jgi:hypothetical protein
LPTAANVALECGTMAVELSERLFEAAKAGRVETVRALVRQGADVHAQTQGGHTPLHMAAAKGHEEVVKALVGLGADVHARDAAGRTPAHVATDPQVKALLERRLAAASAAAGPRCVTLAQRGTPPALACACGARQPFASSPAAAAHLHGVVRGTGRRRRPPDAAAAAGACGGDSETAVAAAERAMAALLAEEEAEAAAARQAAARKVGAPTSQPTATRLPSRSRSREARAWGRGVS